MKKSIRLGIAIPMALWMQGASAGSQLNLAGRITQRLEEGRFGRVALCHYSRCEDTWIKIHVKKQVAIHHLARHDDTLPGGFTSKTGTQLDDDCGVLSRRPPEPTPDPEPIPEPEPTPNPEPIPDPEPAPDPMPTPDPEPISDQPASGDYV